MCIANALILYTCSGLEKHDLFSSLLNIAVAIMASRSSELDRMNSLRGRLPYMSQSALSSILKIYRDEPDIVPKAVRRADIRDARDAMVRRRTPYGALHQCMDVETIKGGTIKVEYQHPMAMLYTISIDSPWFSNMVERAHNTTPSNHARPWSLIYYNDEVTIGNQLRKRNPRKCEAIYWSLLEFGLDALSDEEAWLEVCVLRSATRKTLRGGISALTAAILGHFFDDDTHNASTGGICLQLHSGRSIVIFIEFAMLLADEAALHAIFEHKGSGGLKICMLCANVYNWKYVCDGEAMLATGGVAHTCHDISKLQLQSNALIKAIMGRLAAANAVMSKTRYASLTKKLGWNLSALLTCDKISNQMRPCTQCVYDWMHVLFVRGVFNVHLGHYLFSLHKLGFSTDDVNNYTSQWNWPGFVESSGLRDMFAKESVKGAMEKQVFASEASKALSMYPILANLSWHLAKNPDPQFQGHAGCFLKLVVVIELIINSSRYSVDPCRFRDAVQAYMEHFKSLYGERAMTPKFHYLMHYVWFLWQFGSIPNCFVLERKHKIVKKYGGPLCNTSKDYSASVLRDITCSHITSLSRKDKPHFVQHVCLIEPKPPSPKLRGLLQQEFGFDLVYHSAKVVRINKWEKVHVGDIVQINKNDTLQVGRVKFLASVTLHDGNIECVAIVSSYIFESKQERSTKWRCAADFVFILASDIISSLIWTASGSRLTCLVPWSQRAA